MDASGLTQWERDTDPLPGQTLDGRYRIIRELGPGRLARVYLAEDVSTGARVALKILRPELRKDEQFVGRFLEQAPLSVGFSKSHPSLATVYECKQAPDGLLYIAMEYLEGRLLSDVIRQEGALDVARALGMAIQIGEGLEVAHNLGFIHGEVRPQNVMVLSDGKTMKLMGFEMARLTHTAAARRLFALAGSGTAPQHGMLEEIAGAAITERTDVYGLGLVLRQMLTGPAPVPASPLDAGRANPLRDPRGALRRRRREIPPALDRVVQHALEEKPQRRPPDISHLVNSLWIEGSRLQTSRRHWSTRPWSPLWSLVTQSRAGLRWTTGAVVGLLVLVGVVMLIGQPPQGKLDPGAPPESTRPPPLQQRPESQPNAEAREPVPGPVDLRREPATVRPERAAPSAAAVPAPAEVTGAVPPRDAAPRERAKPVPTTKPAAAREAAPTQSRKPASVSPGDRPATVKPERAAPSAAAVPAPAEVTGAVPPRDAAPRERVKPVPTTTPAAAREAAPTQSRKPAAVSPGDRPATETGEPDPAGIIDWLLNDYVGRRD